ncbi:MAG: hypothetical protein GKR89_24615 [Candidatus Latescibacteria bacterium]|nr:hypothetical protein [Candidatus Latescibacterota bacterium]
MLLLSSWRKILLSAAFLAALLSLSAFALLQGESRNIGPDAISRATIWNTHSGSLELLNDGQAPPDNTSAEAFTWETKGILIFAWDRPLPVEKVRIFVGEIGNNYQLRTYLGGHLQEDGALREPEGEQTALVEENRRLINQWIEIDLPLGTWADNLELWTLGSTVFYEVEIYARLDEATALAPLSWGQVKSRAAGP